MKYVSGDVTINDTLLQVAIEDLPFDTFSHQKSILEVRGLLGFNLFKGTKMARPPYGQMTEWLFRYSK
ncbi:MAG TPA: hypothetical protein DCW35_00495 [Polynucleobacter sp.]|nr:hypothetical protein [Polynucleobacter sp.]